MDLGSMYAQADDSACSSGQSSRPGRAFRSTERFYSPWVIAWMVPHAGIPAIRVRPSPTSPPTHSLCRFFSRFFSCFLSLLLVSFSIIISISFSVASSVAYLVVFPVFFEPDFGRMDLHRRTPSVGYELLLPDVEEAERVQKKHKIPRTKAGNYTSNHHHSFLLMNFLRDCEWVDGCGWLVRRSVCAW